jgi:hypothetical protein
MLQGHLTERRRSLKTKPTAPGPVPLPASALTISLGSCLASVTLPDGVQCMTSRTLFCFTPLHSGESSSHVPLCSVVRTAQVTVQRAGSLAQRKCVTGARDC